MNKYLWDVLKFAAIWPFVFVLARTHPIATSFYFSCFLIDYY